ncbi:MAG: SEC-C domain-containing protein [Peptococcaceae bacterium]|nr:SEC-C domain-containing protein [Peptococcaceae bacterium]
MDRDIDRETYERLLEALNMAKEESNRMRQKQEAKLWADIEVPLSLSRALSRLTKDELTQIRQNLDIKNLSALKKQDLTEELLKLIPESVEKVFLQFDDNRYSLAKRIVSNGGFTPYRGLETGQVEYLRDRGIIFPGTSGGRKALVMPQEIIKVFKRIDGDDFQRRVRRNREWIWLTQGLLYYYGIMNLYQLRDILQKYTGEKIDTAQYLHLMLDAESYYGEIRQFSSGFSNYRVWDPEKVKKEQEARPDVDYYPFTREQLLRAGEPGFVERNSAYTRFKDFIIENYEISREEADSIAEECVFAVMAGDSPPDIIKYLQNRLEINTFDTLQSFTDLLTHLMNNTRQWVLKGHTPEELFAREKSNLKPLPVNMTEVIDIKTRRKVGRNDPCPCGSGKKFKKCCGR